MFIAYYQPSNVKKHKEYLYTSNSDDYLNLIKVKPYVCSDIFLEVIIPENTPVIKNNNALYTPQVKVVKTISVDNYPEYRDYILKFFKMCAEQEKIDLITSLSYIKLEAAQDLLQELKDYPSFAHASLGLKQSLGIISKPENININIDTHLKFLHGTFDYYDKVTEIVPSLSRSKQLQIVKSFCDAGNIEALDWAKKCNMPFPDKKDVFFIHILEKFYA